MAFKPELIEFASRDAMAAHLADRVEAKLGRGIANDGRGELAVSGGSTPNDLYRALAKRELSWSDIAITLVDERWVGLCHPRSNEAFVRSAFAGADAEFIGLYNGAATALDGVNEVAAVLRKRQKPFDAVILGMGEDGHTASWFPAAAGLNGALNSNTRLCAITADKSDITGEEVERMTLTLSAISDAHDVILMFVGEGKRAAFEKALEDGSVEDMPVRAILTARPDLLVCWAP